MKRELDPFESKIKEKLQGKAQFPEDILWKRLNDELTRSDRSFSQKRSLWWTSTAILVVLALVSGYFMGKSDVFSPKKTVEQAQSTLPKNTGITSQKSKKTGTKDSEQTSNPSFNGMNSLEKAIELNQPKKPLHSESTELASTIFPVDVKAIKTDQTLSHKMTLTDLGNITNAPKQQVVPLRDVSEELFALDRLEFAKLSSLPKSTMELSKGYQKTHKPVFLSASLACEPSLTNKIFNQHVYGTNQQFSSTERGVSATNLRFGLQTQIGAHFELGTGFGTARYLTEQIVQNQQICVDQYEHHLDFESSVSHIEIHEDHLHDDPEDQEEHELNFEDSTEFHLNYAINTTIESYQIPLNVAYLFQFQKFKFALRTGLIYNHISSANQEVLINGFDAIRSDIQAKTNTNSMYHMVQFGAEFPLSSHVSFVLSPKYTYALKSISRSTMLRPNSLGLECALKFYF